MKHNSIVTVAFACLLLCLPASANANQAPQFIAGTVTPSEAYQGPFILSTEWQDPDGDFIVDVAVRIQKNGSQEEIVKVLEYVPGSSPPAFRTSMSFVEESGSFNVAFRASDANPADGPRFHTTDWIPSGDFTVRSGAVGGGRNCIGNDYEQRDVLPDVRKPMVKMVFDQFVAEGQTIILSAEETVDIANGATPSFFWCTDLGSFSPHPDFPDYSKVNYTAPLVPGSDRNTEIFLKVGDGLGYVARTRGILRLTEAGISNPDDPSPIVSASIDSEWIVGHAPIAIELFDINTAGQDSAALLLTDVIVRNVDGFELFGKTGLRGDIHEIVLQPKWPISDLEVEVRTTDGNTRKSVFLGPVEVLPRFNIAGYAMTASGAPISNVEVLNSTEGYSQLTDTNGRFDFRISDAGTYILTARKEGVTFENSLVEITLANDEPIAENIKFIAKETGIPRNFSIDIKPGSDTNPINPRSRGKIPVAILSDADFNATTDIVRTSLTFGSTGDEESLHYRGNGEPNCGEEDVNADGRLDLVCHFYTQIANFQTDDTEGILRGQTTEGEDFEARDSIRIVGNSGGPDNDADGVDDDTENAGPNNGDANNDGLLDSAQANVTALLSSSGNYLALVSSPDCTNTAVSAVGPSELPTDTSGLEAPEGFLSFTLTTCNSSDTTVFFHGRDDLGSADYRRYGPTAENPSDHWYSLPATFRSVVIDGELVATANFQLVDGGLGDDDLIFNGEIVDPGGPAIRGTGVTDIPSASTWSLLLLAIFLGSGAIYLISRRH